MFEPGVCCIINLLKQMYLQLDDDTIVDAFYAVVTSSINGFCGVPLYCTTCKCVQGILPVFGAFETPYFSRDITLIVHSPSDTQVRCNVANEDGYC